MLAPTRYLLDKVVARYTLEGILALSSGRGLTDQQEAALTLFHDRVARPVDLFIAPASANILRQLQRIPHFAPLIQLFLQRVQIATPTRYFTRWARRVREFGFSPEDARMLALASFSTDEGRNILGMHRFITYDHPLINLWDMKQDEIERRFDAMRQQLMLPYDQAQLPTVQLLE